MYQIRDVRESDVQSLATRLRAADIIELVNASGATDASASLMQGLSNSRAG